MLEAKEVEKLDVDALSAEETDKIELPSPASQEPVEPAETIKEPESKVDPEPEKTPDPDKKPDEKKAEETKESDQKVDDPEKKDESDKLSPDEQISKYEKRLKDTQTELTLSTMSNKKLQDEFDKLDKEKFELLEKQHKLSLESFEKLTDKEAEDLKYDDPDKYIEYRDQERLHNLKETEFQDSKKEVVRQQAFDSQQDEILKFVRTVKGIDTNDEAALTEYLKSEEWKNLDKSMVDENSSFRANATGVFSAKTMKIALGEMTSEQKEADLISSTRKKTLDSIENAQNGGSKLDQVAQEPNDNKPKTLESLTNQDISNMQPEEVEQWLKKAGTTRDVAV